MKLSTLSHLINKTLMVTVLFGSVMLPVHAQLSFLGIPRSQDFNELITTGSASWTQNITLPGWYLRNNNGNGNVTTYFADEGATATGRIYSYGTGTSTERALGSVSSSSSDQYYYLRLTNQSGQTITNFTLKYTGEQWRRAANASAQRLDFSYRLFSSAPSLVESATYTASYTDFDDLDFSSPVTGTVAATLDGNAAANRSVKMATVTINWLPNAELWLRWYDDDNTGTDHGLAIDDVSFAVYPTVTSLSSTTIAAGSTNQNLTITGTHFFSDASTVLWNGSTIAPTSVTPTQITFAIPNSYLSKPGYAKISVSNTGSVVSETAVLVITETPADNTPNLTVGISSVGKSGNTVTVDFFIANRSTGTATSVTILAADVSLAGKMADDPVTINATTVAPNGYIKGTATFTYSPSAPGTGTYLFRLKGKFNYSSTTGSFATAQRISVP
jgi:hypothetical protein